jgi:hypothetical protein
MNVICRIRGHRPIQALSIYDPTPEECVEMDVADLPTLHFTIESCERCDRQLRVGVGLPGEPIELVSPSEAHSRTVWLTQVAIDRTNQSGFADEY